MNRTALLDGVKVITTTELCKRLGITMPATRLAKVCNVSAFAETTYGTFWRETDVPILCTGIAQHLMQVAQTELVRLSIANEPKNG